jgi:Rrf2 family nitric oxide-sensitive transcriptional repressor
MFSQTTEYALRAMACLALKPDELVPTPVLARQTQVPENYLAKVLQQLAAAGLIVGRRGVGGGYRLAKSATTIRLIEVIRAVAELKRIETCPLGLPNHGPNLCPLHRKMDQVIEAAITLLDDHTLADVISKPGANVPLCDAVATARLSIRGR